MSTPVAITEPGSWFADGHAIRIEWPAIVLEEIRQAAVEGFHRIARGGVEVGGVLFGRHEGDLVHIVAFRPVACEHAFGPGFVLSGNDQAVLRKTLEEESGDPGLSGLEPVGWYHSHTRSQVLLSDQDLEVYSRFFPERWQIALVLRVEPSFPAARTRAGFFFRERDGSVRSESSYREVVLEPAARARPAEPAPDAEVEAREAEAPEPVAEQPSPEPDVRSRFRWLWLGLLVSVVAVAAGVLLKTYWLAAGEEALALQVTDAGGHLRIEWDRAAAPVRDAAGGSLEIRDGSERVELPIDARRLREGRVTYARRSENVDVRLKVRRADGRVEEEVVQFLGPPVAAAPAPAESAAARPSEEQPQPPPAPIERRAVKPTAQFQQPPVKTTAPEPLPQLPGLPASGPPAAIQAGLPPQVNGQPRPAPPPPVKEVAKPAPAQPAYTGPPSGRIIWTGQLARGAQLTIQGRRCSSGAVTSELPGVPVRIRASPGELSSRGITIFVAEPKRANVTEAPGPQNGWNRTTYAWDRARSLDAIVLESPAAENNWKSLVLRSERQDLSLIFIDWQVAR